MIREENISSVTDSGEKTLEYTQFSILNHRRLGRAKKMFLTFDIDLSSLCVVFTFNY